MSDGTESGSQSLLSIPGLKPGALEPVVNTLLLIDFVQVNLWAPTTKGDRDLTVFVCSVGPGSYFFDIRQRLSYK